MTKRLKHITLFLLVSTFSVWLFCLPKDLFDISYSSVLYDKSGALLGAHIAQDEQWRFPPSDTLPDKYIRALLCFEDKRFYKHAGFDPLAMGRAMVSNLKAGHVVSGGSTITMQLMRMARNRSGRSIGQKIIEIFLATRAEVRYSKEEILSKYAANAPFGGNVVGLEAAAWRYFGKSPLLLSWAEAATMAVLPNSPALIHPGRNRDQLRHKRDQLLSNMAKSGIISEREATLSTLEPLPQKTFDLPQIAPHYLNFAQKKGFSKIISDLDKDLQNQLNSIIDYRAVALSDNEIHNMAAIVIEVKTGKVIGYVGNTMDAKYKHANAVDMVQAERSSGSILKPILYASALQDGLIYPQMLLEDIPANIYGYKPKNYHRGYDGMVPADEALYRSLNVPAVRLLQQYGIGKFKSKLEEAGITTLHYSPDHYGLPLIIGGAEITLWDITHTYANMAKVLDSAFDNNHDLTQAGPWHYGALWSTIQAMQEVKRPDENGQWETFIDAHNIAWKTGTSYGFKDAWAVGITPEYAVGIWVGNADGEGRPELVGFKAAAPVLFDVFRLLPNEKEFEPPYDALLKTNICRTSGHPASNYCTEKDEKWVPNVSYKIPSCLYHQQIFLDPTRSFQVNKTCFPATYVYDTTMFVLDAIPAHYYKSRHPQYQPLPPVHPNCTAKVLLTSQKSLQLIYPPAGTKVYIPIDYNGETQSMVCQVAKGQSDQRVYWYLDDQFMGTTLEFNTLAISPKIGQHRIVVKDALGHTSSSTFEVLSQ